MLNLKNRPTVIFTTTNNIMLSGILEDINKNSLRISGDISILIASISTILYSILNIGNRVINPRQDFNINL